MQKKPTCDPFKLTVYSIRCQILIQTCVKSTGIQAVPLITYEIQELWKTPPTHPWYNRQAPGGALSIKADRVVQTTISRLASGHTRGLSFHLGQKIYENCTKCNLVLATPDRLLLCAGLDREDIYSSPLLVYDFLSTLGLMDLV
ncbi:RNase H domain-containing protein [Trichonephila clavipes]|nr:RNase H domain-containing protein [Trichonephila clavipes]